jgi:putative CocE/NonD family hydrolase
LIGPWYHDPTNFRSGKTGDVDFGPEARFNEEDLMFRWFDWLLKGKPTGLEQEKPVRVFVMGKNVWREEDDWPLARAVETRYYLHSGGRANSASGDGILTNKSPHEEPADKFVYDPADPVMTLGGGNCCDHEHLAPGAFDQRSIESREDVLVYTSDVLREELEVTGPVRLELYISSSAVDTDFTGKLVDVSPNGFAQNLTDGILRLRYRNSFSKAELMNPGETYKVVIDLWATSNVFLAGHRIRLEVSSSNFPRFDRNLNTGECAAQATHMVKAQNTVFHDAAHPSAVILPVIPAK